MNNRIGPASRVSSNYVVDKLELAMALVSGMYMIPRLLQAHGENGPAMRTEKLKLCLITLCITLTDGESKMTRGAKLCLLKTSMKQAWSGIMLRRTTGLSIRLLSDIPVRRVK